METLEVMSYGVLELKWEMFKTRKVDLGPPYIFRISNKMTIEELILILLYALICPPCRGSLVMPRLRSA